MKLRTINLKKMIDKNIRDSGISNTFGDVYDQLMEEYLTWDNNKWDKLNVYFSATKIKRSKVIIHDNLKVVAKNITEQLKDVLIIMPTIVPSSFITNLSRTIQAMNSLNKKACFALVCDGIVSARTITEITACFQNLKRQYIIFNTQNKVGYTCAMKLALEYINGDFQYIGFVDDDAYILNLDHYNLLIKKLETNLKLAAVSGIAIDYDNENPLHNFFNSGNSYDVVSQAKKRGVCLHKPHIHGGGGACLMRASEFNRYLNFAIDKGLLLGPVVSSISRKKGYTVYALQDSLVLHPTKSSFFDWLITIRKYYNSWQKLQKILSVDDGYYRKEYLFNLEDYLKQYYPKDYQKYLIFRKFRTSFKN